MKLNKIELKKIQRILKKLPMILAERTFLTFLIFLFLALILGGLVFYKYNPRFQKIEPQITEEPLKFEEKTYKEVLKIWQEREEKVKEADLKKYPDPFR